MKYLTPKCPECGELPFAEVDFVPGNALIVINEDGTFEHTGSTIMCWDGQTNTAQLVDNKPSHIRVVMCEQGHEWETVVDELDVQALATHVSEQQSDATGQP